jgi:nitric oxide reductase subunit B
MRNQAPQSGLWKHGLLLTLLFGFTVMIVGGFVMYKSRAPIPNAVLGPRGETLFTSRDIQEGQEIFRKRDLMNYGSVLGHGAYLGPDYTAEAIHFMTEAMRTHKAPGYATLALRDQAGIDAEVKAELKQNRYNPADGTLRFTEAQAAGWKTIVAHYDKVFREGQPERALQRDILAGESPEDLAAFVTWTAWLSVAKRPEANHSYTNNWPYDEAAGNTATPGAMMWSAVSAAALLFFLALILYFQHRYQLSIQDVPNPRYQFDLLRMPLTPSQKATAKYFVVVILLFLVQSLLGGKMAHDYADGASFFGIAIADLLPFNVARTWHLQLAIFWIATAWLGMGIFIAPLVSGR